jgi:hypothetical protein
VADRDPAIVADIDAIVRVDAVTICGTLKLVLSR